VDVVTAGVHNAGGLAFGIGGMHLGGVVDAGLLFNGQRVHVGANEQTWTGTIFQDSDNAPGLRAIHIFSDVLGDRVAELAKIGGELGRGLLFMMRELGMAMEVFVGFGEGGQLRLYGLRQGLLRGGGQRHEEEG
jgi:hypothetical protein